jgi:hypothetical protein
MPTGMRSALVGHLIADGVRTAGHAAVDSRPRWGAISFRCAGSPGEHRVGWRWVHAPELQRPLDQGELEELSQFLANVAGAMSF